MRYFKLAVCGALTLAIMSGLGFGAYMLTKLFPSLFVGYLTVFAVFFAFIMIFGDSAETRLLYISLIIVLPYLGFGVVLYLAADKTVFSPKRKKFSLSSYTAAFTELRKQSPDGAKVARYLDYRTKLPVLFSDDIVYFSDPSLYLNSIIYDVGRAEKYVIMEFYIVKQGLMLSRLETELYKALERGVEVKITVDYIGSSEFCESPSIKSLKSRGAKIAVFRKPFGIFGMRFNTRTHRKICVIDGTAAYLGGINFSDEETKIKDSGMRFIGDAAKQIETMAYRLWGKSVNFEYQTQNKGKGFVQPFSVNGRNTIEGVYSGVMSAARKEILISTPYLSLSDAMLSQIELLASMGVKIKVVIPEKSTFFIKAVNRVYSAYLEELGAEVYLYEAKFLHEKLIVADGAIAVSGSPNFDLRSSSYQIESGVIIYDNRVIDELITDFNLLISESVPFGSAKKKGLFRGKIFSRLVRLMAYFV